MAEYRRDSEFEEKIVQVNRVSKKTTGGNKIGFSVLVVVGDRQGKVGVGLGKAPGVQDAIRKAATYGKKHMIVVPMRDTTITHEIYIKKGAAKVLLKPAAKGTGVIAGGAVRAVVEAAGIKDILSKVLGTSNKASNVYATLEALKNLRPMIKQVENIVGKNPQEKVIKDAIQAIDPKKETAQESKKPVKKEKTPIVKKTTKKISKKEVKND